MRYFKSKDTGNTIACLDKIKNVWITNHRIINIYYFGEREETELLYDSEVDMEKDFALITKHLNAKS